VEIGIYFNYKERGPGKVVDNLIKGLDILNIKYRINSDGDKNIILQNCDRLNGDLSNCILGPNICTLPIDNSVVMNYDRYESLLVPSEWVKKLYMRWIPESKIKIWTVGIDTNIFSDKSSFEKKYDFLIYFKRRSIDELNFIIDQLNIMNKNYIIMEYGKYKEFEFIDVIEKSKYGIVIDNCESQGIAIQEMMSCNLPLLVWDVKYWIDRGYENKCNATSIPYWDSSCGEFFYDKREFNEKVNLLEKKSYKPRDFLMTNISLEITTKEIIEYVL
jgi:glycosyltransferase involved in cell wall biosynthesis